jgi:aminopeptidase N
VRTFANVALGSDELALLGGLLDGSAELPGLAVDTDLRWAFLRRLVSTGTLTDDAIDAELERDHTASGQRHAAAVRAARPTAAAKAEAWRQTVESDELPNALLTATIAGFNEPDHRELLRPYIDRYFGSVQDIWESRTTEMANNIVTGLFPAFFVEQAVVDRTEDYLTTKEPVPGLARLLAEGRDGLQRAIRCQSVGAGD